jgi:hypothetical protein
VDFANRRRKSFGLFPRRALRADARAGSSPGPRFAHHLPSPLERRATEAERALATAGAAEAAGVGVAGLQYPRAGDIGAARALDSSIARRASSAHPQTKLRSGPTSTRVCASAADGSAPALPGRTGSSIVRLIRPDVPDMIVLSLSPYCYECGASAAGCIDPQSSQAIPPGLQIAWAEACGAAEAGEPADMPNMPNMREDETRRASLTRAPEALASLVQFGAPRSPAQPMRQGCFP